MSTDSRGRKLNANESQLKDGRYRYRYVDGFGTRKTIYSWKLVKSDRTPVGKKDDLSLREKIKNIEKMQAEGIRLFDDSLIVEELLRLYITSKTELANSTRETYTWFYNTHVKGSVFGGISIRDVKKSTIQQFYAQLRNDGFTVGTIQMVQNILYPTFQTAVDDSLIRSNPCKGCMRAYKFNRHESEKAHLTKEEQTALLNFVKTAPFYDRYYTMLLFMLGTGCRISETLGITWDNIDLDSKVVTVDHQILYRKKDGKVVHYAGPTKNKLVRKIPIQEILVEELKQYKKETYMLSRASGIEIDGYSGFVFLNRENKLYTPATINRALHGMRNAYNDERDPDAPELPNFSAHSLRHTFCTRLASSGIDVKVLQDIMGHKSITVTMEVYNHSSLERAQNALSGIPDVLSDEDKKEMG